MNNFYRMLSAAIADLLEFGYDSEERLRGWLLRLEASARTSLASELVVQQAMRASLRRIYETLVEREQLIQLHPGADPYTIKHLRPELHGELQRRLSAATNLIKLNRDRAVANTLRRFYSWGTSIPSGGSGEPNKLEVAFELRKELRMLPFEDRRVVVDQGHKFTSALNEIVAANSGAIAAEWHSRWRQPGYNYRPDHKERDEHVYLIKGSWAHEQGLVKPGASGYYDDITKPGEEVFCRCSVVYLYAPGELPPDMLTFKGARKLAEVREALA